MRYDDPYYDEYGQDWQEQTSQPPQNAPAPPPVTRGSSDEHLAALGVFEQFKKTHPYLANGDPYANGDPLELYKSLREGGYDHNNAINVAISRSGWDDPSKWQKAAAPAPVAAAASSVKPAKSAAAKPVAKPTTAAAAPTKAINTLLTPYSGVFNPPDPNTAVARARARLPGMPAIKEWQAPDPASILNDPSYQFRISEGMKALENSASAKGLTRHPNQRQGLIQYGQNFASNEYQGLFDRELTGYKTNVGNTLDLFDRDLNTSIQAERGADQEYNRAYDEYELDWRMFDADQRRRLDLLQSQSNQGLSASR